MTDFLVRRITGQPRHPLARVGIGVGLAGLVIAARLALVPSMGQGMPFVAFIPAVLLATLLGGGLSGVTAALILAFVSPFVLLPHDQQIGALRRLVLGEALFLGSSGFVIWIVATLRATVAREVAAREAEGLLRLELHHRVKNTLAVVQALADQSFREGGDPDADRQAFHARLSALAGVHDVLVERAWRSVALDALAERALAPFRPARPDALVLSGPPVAIPPEAAVALALCLHELATNAAKHGALSSDRGHVRLSWRIDGDADPPRLSLEWRETGGPAPAPDSSRRQGFGARLLARALAARPGAQAALEFLPDGARWTAAFDLDAA
ncbi:sensor histidine kinase [Phenylobacterium sp.]|uniref:sensor histidine kinase n=1 Tax=Phenylobacterium sp. TaxID=1871053 RepID=UPI00301D3169